MRRGDGFQHLFAQPRKHARCYGSRYGIEHEPCAESAGTPITSDMLRQLLQSGDAGASTMGAIRDALAQALHLTFWAIFALSLAVLCSAVFVPRVAIRAAPAAVKPEL